MPFGTRILQACQHGKTYFSIDLSELDQGHVGSPKVTDLLHYAPGYAFCAASHRFQRKADPGKCPGKWVSREPLTSVGVWITPQRTQGNFCASQRCRASDTAKMHTLLDFTCEV